MRHGGYPGLDGKEAPFKRFSTRIEHLAIDHCILLGKREQLVTPLLNFAHPVWQIWLDRVRWTTLISSAFGQGDLVWPSEMQGVSH